MACKKDYIREVIKDNFEAERLEEIHSEIGDLAKKSQLFRNEDGILYLIKNKFKEGTDFIGSINSKYGANIASLTKSGNFRSSLSVNTLPLSKTGIQEDIKFSVLDKNKAPLLTKDFAENLFSFLETKFGISGNIIDDKDKKWKGALIDNTPTINIAYADLSDGFHEYLHPFMMSMRLSNLKLFNKLYKELSTLPEFKEIGQRALKKVQTYYPNLKNIADFQEEVLVTALGYASELKSNNKLTELNKFNQWVNDIFGWLNKFFIDFLSVKRPISKMSLDTTLGDVVDWITDIKTKILLDSDWQKLSKLNQQVNNDLNVSETSIANTFANDYLSNLDRVSKAFSFDDYVQNYIKEKFKPKKRDYKPRNFDRQDFIYKESKQFLINLQTQGYQLQGKEIKALPEIQDKSIQALANALHPLDLNYRFADWLYKKGDIPISLNQEFKAEGITKYELEILSDFKGFINDKYKGQKSLPASVLAAEYEKWATENYGINVTDAIGYSGYGLSRIIGDSSYEYTRKLFVDDFLSSKGHSFEISGTNEKGNGLGWYASVDIEGDGFDHEFQSDLLPEISKSFELGQYEQKTELDTDSLQRTIDYATHNKIQKQLSFSPDFLLYKVVYSDFNLRYSDEEAKNLLLSEIEVNITTLKQGIKSLETIPYNKAPIKLIDILFRRKSQEFAELQDWIRDNFKYNNRSNTTSVPVVDFPFSKVEEDWIDLTFDNKLGYLQIKNNAEVSSPKWIKDIVGVQEEWSKSGAPIKPKNPITFIALVGSIFSSVKMDRVFDFDKGELKNAYANKNYFNNIRTTKKDILSKTFTSYRISMNKLRGLEFRRELYKDIDKIKQIASYYKDEYLRYRKFYEGVYGDVVEEAKKSQTETKVQGYERYKKYSDLAKKWWDITIQHSINTRKLQGRAYYYLPTGTAMEAIEGNSIAKGLYLTPEEAKETEATNVQKIQAFVESNTQESADEIRNYLNLDGFRTFTGYNLDQNTPTSVIADYLLRKTNFWNESDILNKWLEDNKGKLYKKTGIFYLTLSKFAKKNGIILTQETPKWSRYPLIKVELSGYNYKPIERFSKLEEEPKESRQQGEITKEIDDKEISKITKELQNLEKEGLSAKVDDFFTMVETQFSKRLAYEKYSEFRKIFENPGIGSDYKLLFEELKQAALKTDEGIAFEKKVLGFALGLQQLDVIASKVVDNLRVREFDSMEDLEKLQELGRYKSFISEWAEFVEGLRKEFLNAPSVLPLISKIQGHIATGNAIVDSKSSKSVLNLVGDILEPTLLIQTEDYSKEKERLEGLIANATKRGALDRVGQYKKRLDFVTERYKREAITPENIADYLMGNRGDTHGFHAFLEAFVSSPDPITYAAKALTKRRIEEAREETRQSDITFQRKLAPLLQKLKYSPLNGFNFWKEFVQETKNLTKDGEQYTKLELLNEFNDTWKSDLQEKQQAVQRAEETGDEELINLTKKELRTHLRDYMYQPFSNEYYDRFENWEDEIGKKAYEQRQVIFDEMSDLQLVLDKTEAQGLDYTPEQYEQQQDLIDRLRRLSALTDENGKSKTGEALEMAKRHEKYAKETKDIVEWKERKGALERARFIFIQGLKAEIEDRYATDTPEEEVEYQERLKEWHDRNMRQANTPEFYNIRQEKINELDSIVKKITDKISKEKKKKVETISKNWQKMFDQIKGYRDADGQPIGTEINEDKTEEIKKIQEDIESLKDEIEGISGLSKDESDLLNSIWLKLKSHQGISTEELEIKNDLEAKRNSLGLSKLEKKRFYELINDLKELQVRIPTDYYINQLNSLIAPLGVNYELSQAQDFTETPDFETFIKDDNFKDWFEKNHIQTLKWNSDTHEREKKWERLYKWNRIVPIDEKYIEKTTLSDGTVLMGKPALKYYYRDVKDKYKTQKIEGVSVDNRGNWLPKTYNARGELIAKDSKYVNQKFYDLKSSKKEDDKARFELLGLQREYLLKAQEELPFKDRLWLEIPRDEKSLGEIVRTTGAKGLGQHFLDKLLYFRNSASTNEEKTNVKQTIVKTDLVGAELAIIPVKYTGKLNSNDVSLDIPRSIMKYTESTNMKKVLMEIHPFIKSLQNLLEANGVRDITKIEATKNNLLNFMRAKLGIKKQEFIQENKKQIAKAPLMEGTYTRLENIRRIERHDYKGIYKEGLVSQGATSFSQGLDYYIFSPLAAFSGVTTLAFDYSGTMVNSISGNGYAYLDGISNRSFSIKDLAQADLIYATKVIPALISDGDQKLGQKSFWGQLIDLYDPQQTVSHRIGERYTSNRTLTTLHFLKNALLNPREYGEHQISVSTMITILKNVRVEYNGKDISLIDAYHIEDGVLRLKDGAEFSKAQFANLKERIRQAIREAQGNYANADQAEIERYVFGRLLFFFRKYLVPMIMDAYGARRFNGAGGVREGYYNIMVKSLNIMREGLQEGVWNWSVLSDSEKRNTYKGIAFLSSTLVFLGLISLIPGGDDREKWTKSRYWSWWKLEFLFQAIRVKSEIEQVSPIGGYNNMVQFFNQPFMVGRKLSQLGNTMDALQYLVTGDKKARYSDKGGYRNMMETLYGTDNKALVSLCKLLGYRGGGLKAQIPTTQASKNVAAYRLKTTSAIQRKN